MGGRRRAGRKADALLRVPPTLVARDVSAGDWTYSGPVDSPHGCRSDAVWSKPSFVLSSSFFPLKQYQFHSNSDADCEPEHSEDRNCQNYCLCSLLRIPQRPFPVGCCRVYHHLFNTSLSLLFNMQLEVLLQRPHCSWHFLPTVD